MKEAMVPSFFLYGEPPCAVSERFLHLEALDDRSRPSDWIIRPHAHANLNHVFFIAEGKGTVEVETQSVAFVAPCILVIPATVIHGFQFTPDTRGSVLTIADTYLDTLLRSDPDLLLVKAFSCASLSDSACFERDLQRLAAELSWHALGHAAAVEGRLLTLLVDVIRAVQRTTSAGPTILGPDVMLLARFRTLIEDRYREELSVDSYASALNTSVSRLRKACRLSMTSPLRLVQERVLLEAKRMLLYSDLTVAEVAFSLGFQDPAYFSRFFVKWADISPLDFRRRRKTAGKTEASRFSRITTGDVATHGSHQKT